MVAVGSGLQQPQAHLPEGLAALVGITDYYHSKTKATLLLGLWLETLSLDLSWYLVGKRDSRIDGIPSWTWLSVDAELMHLVGVSESNAPENSVQAIDWEVSWSSQPLTSKIISSKLLLSGLIKQIILPILPVINSHELKNIQIISEGEHSGYCRLDLPIDSSESEVVLLLLHSQFKPKTTDKLKEQFLILSQLPESGPQPKYRRLGIGTVHTDINSQPAAGTFHAQGSGRVSGYFTGAERAIISLM